MFLFLKIKNVKNGARESRDIFFTKPQIGSGSGSVAMYRSTSSTIFCNSRERGQNRDLSDCLSVCLSSNYLFACGDDDEKKSDEFFFFFFRKKSTIIESLESGVFLCSLSLSKSLFFFFSFLPCLHDKKSVLLEEEEEEHA